MRFLKRFGVLSYLIGTDAAWLSVHAAFLIYLLTPLFFIVPLQSRRVAQAGAASDVMQATNQEGV